MSHLLQFAPLLLLLLVAAAWDARTRLIPNWLTLLVITGGIAQSFSAAHVVGPGASLLGILVGAAIPFVLFAIGALGGGDVKLMAGVGAWLGPLPALAVFAAAAVVGMMIVLAQALAQGRLQTLARNSLVVALSLVHVRQVGIEHAAGTGQSARSVDRPLPYAVPVFVSVLLLTLWEIAAQG